MRGLKTNEYMCTCMYMYEPLHPKLIKCRVFWAPWVAVFVCFSCISSLLNVRWRCSTGPHRLLPWSQGSDSVDCVDVSTYLGSCISPSALFVHKISAWIQKAGVAFTHWCHLWRRTDIRLAIDQSTYALLSSLLTHSHLKSGAGEEFQHCADVWLVGNDEFMGWGYICSFWLCFDPWLVLDFERRVKGFVVMQRTSFGLSDYMIRHWDKDLSSDQQRECSLHQYELSLVLLNMNLSFIRKYWKGTICCHPLDVFIVRPTIPAIVWIPSHWRRLVRLRVFRLGWKT